LKVNFFEFFCLVISLLFLSGVSNQPLTVLSPHLYPPFLKPRSNFLFGSSFQWAIPPPELFNCVPLISAVLPPHFPPSFLFFHSEPSLFPSFFLPIVRDFRFFHVAAPPATSFLPPPPRTKCAPRRTPVCCPFGVFTQGNKLHPSSFLVSKR